MAIDAYTGLPRSGKSYSVVKNVILPSLREGRHVYTNIPLTDKLKDEFPGLVHQLDAKWFSDPNLVDTFPNGAVVILDELWRRWPSGLKANNVNFKDKEFLAEHGHLVDENGNTTRVVLVSQDLSQIAAFARDLVSVTYRSTKLDAVGAESRFRVDIYQGAVTGQRPPKSQLLRSTYDKYEPQFYDYYKSSTKSMTGEVGDESRADKRSNIWTSKAFIGMLIGSVFMIGGGGYGLYWVSQAGSRYAAKEAEIRGVSEPAQLALVNPEPTSVIPIASSAAIANAPASTQVNPTPSSLWRVSGYIRVSDSPPDQPQWPSVAGYGVPPDEPKRLSRFATDMAVLSSMAGNRYIPLSDCQPYSDRINYYCDVDGERVTPWSGQMGMTETFKSTAVSHAPAVSAASGATKRTQPGMVGDVPVARQ